MDYEINVAKNNMHYFKVNVPYRNVKKVYEELKEKFPDCELMVTMWETIGRKVDMEKFKY